MFQSTYFKKFLLAVCACVFALGLTACSGAADKSSGNSTDSSDNVITVGASPSPHAEILKAIEPELKKAGFELKVVEFSDYIQPNVALASGELDANYFQHKPYLDNYAEENKVELVSAGAIHFEPMGIFAGTSSSLDQLDGAKVAVPSDPTNEARALLLLESKGFFKLKDGIGLEATPKDIVDNPHHVDIYEAKAATLPRTLQDVNFAVINGNYALSAKVDESRLLATEAVDSEAAKTYANIIAVKKDKLDDPKTKALIAALTSDTCKDFIKKTYGNVVVPVF